jgi:hypothetical protein
MIFIVFHGKEQIHAHAGKGITHHLPLIVLSHSHAAIRMPAIAIIPEVISSVITLP